MTPVRAQLALLAGLLIVLGLSAAPLLLLLGSDASGLEARPTPLAGGLTRDGRAIGVRLHDLDALDPGRDAVLIVAPDAAYPPGDVVALATFLRAGGRAVIADDASAGIQLVGALAAGIELTSTRVYSPDFDEDPRRILARATDALPALGDAVPLDRPVLVRGGTPILVPPPLTWEDRNGNGRPDLDEPLAAGSFAALARVGEGWLLVVGDPTALGGRAPGTREALLDWLTEGGQRTLVVDASHRALSDPLGLGRALVWDYGVAASTGILMMIAGVGAIAVLAPRVRRKPAPARGPSRRRAPDLTADILGELEP